MKRLLILTLLAVWVLPTPAARARQFDPIRPVHTADVGRYLGRWHVLAAITPRFERDSYNAVETFRRNDDGSLCIWLRQRHGGFDAPARLFKSTASVVEGSGHGEWRVRFFAFLSARYLVGWLKADGTQAMVVRDARDYLWFLSRTPTVSEADYAAMLDRASAMGYDPTAIRRVPQRWPELGAGSDRFAGACP
ncbi:lipocalin family protein [Rhodanobacter sp. UC4437_H4]